jgi:two-component system sensor histidine kinase and response regulator WspE
MSGIDPALFELFREEVRGHVATLAAGLLELEADPANPQRVEPLMRAAHSVKGAARIAGIEPAVRLAHVMEDALVAAQAGRVRIAPVDIDHLLQGADALAGLGQLPDPGAVTEWVANQSPAIARLEPIFRALAGGAPAQTPPTRAPEAPVARPAPVAVLQEAGGELPAPPPHDAVPIPPDPIPLAGEYGMLDLFREEVRSHLRVVSAGIAALESGSPPSDDVFESLRQIRGSARVMKLPPVEVAVGAVATYLTAVRESRSPLLPAGVEWLRYAVNTLAGVIGTDEETFPAWVDAATGPLEQVAAVLHGATSIRADSAQRAAPQPAPPPVSTPTPSPEPPGEPTPSSNASPAAAPTAEAVVRVTAQNLSRLMGLAGESLVQARWLQLFSTALLKLKKHHEHLAGMLDGAFDAAAAGLPPEQLAPLVADARRQAAACREELGTQAADFDDHAARAEDLNGRLYREVIASRMRPFGDGTHGLARMVRDISRALGKQARLVVVGEDTAVDRDVLEKLEAPLTHLIRNAVDHGIDTPAERAAAGKPEGGTVRLEARHRAGMLSVSVADDGRGIDPERLRQKVIERGLHPAELVRQLSEPELLEFLFLPGFSTAAGVTEFSGRGVGLDVVRDTVRRIGGSVRISTQAGRGTTFHLQLPITLSVIRAVVVEVGGEPYAFPHTRIDRLLHVPRDDVRSVEHRQFVAVDGHNVGLVLAGQLLDVPADPPKGADLSVVLLSDATGAYGLVVDAIRGEQDLVVRPLDPRLGKVPNLSSAAVLDDGEPVLIVDVEDLVRSMDQFIQSGALRRCEVREAGAARKKRVLVVDDSITVREVERQLLAHHGYEVAVAVDGVDGWNQVRADRYDLLITDVDMPRMTGIQLVQAVRADAQLKDLPVVIVSYKEREEDRLRGLEVGANAYLTKGSFHDHSFVRAVEELIGPA